MLGNAALLNARSNMPKSFNSTNIKTYLKTKKNSKKNLGAKKCPTSDEVG